MKRGVPCRSSAARREMLVWPQRPKTRSTPRARRNRATWSATVGFMPPPWDGLRTTPPGAYKFHISDLRVRYEERSRPRGAVSSVPRDVGNLDTSMDQSYPRHSRTMGHEYG